VRRSHRLDVKANPALTLRRGRDSFVGNMTRNEHVPAHSLHPRTFPELVAHRGASRERPENTLAAFAVALDQRAEAIELDVHATADGVVVVHHDPVPHGLYPDGRRERGPIAELRYVELSTLRTAGEAIPTLRDVLALVGDRATVYVEIKGAGIEQLVIDVVRASEARCAIHSFDHAAIARVRTLAPEIPRGLLFEEGGIDVMLRTMESHDARYLWPAASLIDAALVDAAHSAGRRVIAWTVNESRLARTLATLGVDALCTDDVPMITAALRTQASR
jgi:glycerophosphoryl diester phosphodiesterase